MSGFVAQLRTARAPIEIAQGAGAFAIRVEAADLWETVGAIVSPATTVGQLRRRVVAEVFPEGERDDDFVVKFRGWEMLDPDASLVDAGVREGSILLLHYRRRRPVK